MLQIYFLNISICNSLLINSRNLIISAFLSLEANILDIELELHKHLLTEMNWVFYFRNYRDEQKADPGITVSWF